MDMSEKKIFIIDYVILNERNNVKTHCTYAHSRKSAEYNTRNMTYPDKINIIKIYSINFNDKLIDDTFFEIINYYKNSIKSSHIENDEINPEYV